MKEKAMESLVCHSVLDVVKQINASKHPRRLKKSIHNDFLERFEELDAGYREFYASDADALKLIHWWIQKRICHPFYNHDQPFLLDYAPYSRDEWLDLEMRCVNEAVPAYRNETVHDRICLWLNECYTLPGECEVMPGDVVFDVGAFSGSTSEYFARKAGAEGTVYGFEPGIMFKTYAEGMLEHPNVKPVDWALGCVKGEMRFYDTGASNSSVMPKANAKKIVVKTTTIDSFIAENRIEKLDFIKMDIEGAEIDALIGGSESIARFRPKMAISAYHKLDDLVTIPKTIRAISGDYAFKLCHFSDKVWEMVLFCIPEKGNVPQPESPIPFAVNAAELVRELAVLDDSLATQHLNKIKWYGNRRFRTIAREVMARKAKNFLRRFL